MAGVGIGFFYNLVEAVKKPPVEGPLRHWLPTDSDRPLSVKLDVGSWPLAGKKHKGLSGRPISARLAL
jgi:hypothetical protein